MKNKCDRCGRSEEINSGYITKYNGQIVCTACLWQEFTGRGGGLSLAEMMNNSCARLTESEGKDEQK